MSVQVAQSINISPSKTLAEHTCSKSDSIQLILRGTEGFVSVQAGFSYECACIKLEKGQREFPLVAAGRHPPRYTPVRFVILLLEGWALTCWGISLELLACLDIFDRTLLSHCTTDNPRLSSAHTLRFSSLLLAAAGPLSRLFLLPSIHGH